jgi:hypothetical protein
VEALRQAADGRPGDGRLWLCSDMEGMEKKIRKK